MLTSSLLLLSLSVLISRALSQTSNDPDDYTEGVYDAKKNSMTAKRVVGMSFWLKYAKTYDVRVT